MRKTLVKGKYQVIPVKTLGNGTVLEVQIEEVATGTMIALDPTLPPGEAETFDVSEPGAVKAIEDLLYGATNKE